MRLLRSKLTYLPDAGPRRRAVMVGLMLLVAGCMSPDDAAQSGGRQDAGADGGDGAVAVAAGVRHVGARKPSRYDPEEFVGYQPDGLLPILGAPDFVRRDGAAQIWQYRAENCVFDLFLYGNGNSSRVAHVDLRERRATDEPVETCFFRMRAKRKPKPAG